MQESDSIQLPIVYASVDDEPMLFANQFVLQVNQDEFILVVGQLQPPLVLGTPEEQREQASRLTHVPVRVIARVGMTRQRVAELAQLLTDQLRRYDEQKGVTK